MLATIRDGDRAADEAAMARKPLLLAMMCFLFGARGGLPDDWFDLFEEFIDQLVRRRADLEGDEGLEVEALKRILSRLAWWLWERGGELHAREAAAGKIAKEAVAAMPDEFRAGLPDDEGRLLTSVLQHSSGLLAGPAGRTMSGSWTASCAST